MQFRRVVVSCVACLFMLHAGFAAESKDILIADFEGKDYGEWEATGEAFGDGPAQGTLQGQMEVDGFKGKGLVNSFVNGDKSVGKLTSPPFKIERKFINFLIGGGKSDGKTCMNLLIGGEVVRTATGPNDRPGGSERLDWSSWDVTDLAGKEAVLQIVDEATGGWGHINIDHIVQSDEKVQAAGPAKREIQIERRYLELPVKNGAAKQRMRYVVDGETVREFEIELADGRPDTWYFSDVSRFKGKDLTVAVDRLSPDSKGLSSIYQTDEAAATDDLYREKYRPQFHFTTRRGWNNDPNGLVFYDGEYHLYYQHNPYGRKWGNMHWGHAVSPDLVHWKELPIAIYPHKFGDWVFSGSAVVDRKNTGGFKTGDNDVIIAAYTSTGRGECIAYSNDRGRTFTDYEGNPVVKHSGRDPKVIWYEPGEHWVMAVYDQRDNSRGIAFYTSPNLKEWEFQSRIDGYYECPEVFELPVDANRNNTRWVVYAADGAYSIGDFDGKSFTTESGKHQFNYGNCFYASQTYSNIPREDGRLIQIGWGRTGHESMPFNQQMNFPVELQLWTTDDGIRMYAEPVKEIELLHKKGYILQGNSLAEGENPLAGIDGGLFHIRARLELGDAKKLGFQVRGTAVSYDVEKREISCGDKKAHLEPINGAIRLELLVDRLSIEIFANEGLVYMPMAFIPPDDDRSLALFCEGGEAGPYQVEVYELKSIWRE